MGLQENNLLKSDPDSLRKKDSTYLPSGIKRNIIAVNQPDKIIYKLSKRQKEGIVDGWQHRLDFYKTINKIYLKNNLFLLHASQEKVFSQWLRVNSELGYNFKLFTPGYIFSLDKNVLKNINKRDSVVGSAMNFTSHTFFIQSLEVSKKKFRLEYIWREDNTPFNGKIVRDDISQTINGNLSTKINKNQDLSLLATYRNLLYINNIHSTQNEETVMGRVDWNGDFLKNNLRSELTYNIGSGRELKKEYVFLKVPTGQGTHTWRDDNKDGIQQLNEFYEAVNPDERNYIKVFTQTDVYIKAYTQNFNYRLNISAPLQWKALGGDKIILRQIIKYYFMEYFTKTN